MGKGRSTTHPRGPLSREATTCPVSLWKGLVSSKDPSRKRRPCRERLILPVAKGIKLAFADISQDALSADDISETCSLAELWA